MPTFQYAGKTAHFRTFGAGKTVILLHAGGSSGRQWRKMAAFLETDFHLVAPDLYGFGETDAWSGPGPLTHDAQADLVRALLENLADDAVHVVGHSYGGATAMRLWLSAPSRIRSLVLIEPIVTTLLPQAGEAALFAEYETFANGFIRQADAGRQEAAWKRFLDLRNGPGTWARLSADAQQKFLKQTRQAVDGFKSNLNNPTTIEDCRRFRVPTLILCGEKTTAPERRVTEILRDEIPNSDYAVIAGAEHMAPLTHPEPVAELVRRHFEANG